MIDFHPLTLADGAAIRNHVLHTACRNCDLNVVNLLSWRFLYATETTIHRGWLLFRFKANGHLAYQIPVGIGDYADIMPELLADAAAQDHPFLMLGVCENVLATLESSMPGHFYATADRAYVDYIYRREALATLAGKKLQSKRNHANRFVKAHPDYVYQALSPADFADCRRLADRWRQHKSEGAAPLRTADEQRSMDFVFDHWDALTPLGLQGATVRIDGRLVAFTYGAPINHDTFDVCLEKADTDVEGAFAIINRDFVRHLPEHYVYVNREEDLGIEGLRQAKLAYHPEVLLQKYTVMTKHPLGHPHA